MNKLEKVLQIISFMIICLGFSMIIWFIVMCIKLAQYDKCKAIDFDTPYCEKYKNF